MCCRLQMGETNLSGGPLRQSYCHSLVLFAISPATILIKNLILSIQSNVYGPCMFSGFGSSKDTVPCPLTHLLASFVAPAETQPASETLHFSYKSTRIKNKKETSLSLHRALRRVTWSAHQPMHIFKLFTLKFLKILRHVSITLSSSGSCLFLAKITLVKTCTWLCVLCVMLLHSQVHS